jgi:glucose-1-phosphate adenylyltransferase
VIGHGSVLRQVVLLGEDFYEGEQPLNDANGTSRNGPPIGIGKGCLIERAIIDKNVRIGDNVTIRGKEHVREFESGQFWIRDGITVIPKGAVIPSGTVI